MVALIVGIILIAFCVFACLPFGLAWGADVVNFLKGCAPVFAAFIGLVAVFIGLLTNKRKFYDLVHICLLSSIHTVGIAFVG